MTTKSKRLAAATLSDPRWASVAARDSSVDGQFFYSVKTTGVYCRPSCPAKPARPENVQFHVTADEAEEAGFRPCKRCKPDQSSLPEQRSAMVAELCQYIERAEQPPSLRALAEHAGLSACHLHRIFKAVAGVTPAAYAEALRTSRVRSGLRQSSTVAGAIYGAGYNSSGRFYEKADKVLGMTPTEYRAKGTNTQIRFAIGQCSLGAILVAASTRGICAILMGDDPEALVRELQDSFSGATLIGGEAGFEQLVAKVVGFVEAPGLGVNLPLDVRGTAFQQRVWQALREIPAGETASYTDIARRIGTPNAVRAVAGACAANKLAVAIPCHRVVRTDGSVSGYRWGVERKRALLERETKSKKP